MKITVAGEEYSTFDNVALQRAVDKVAMAGGGEVEVPAGIYEMRDALHLRDGVLVRGEAGTIFRKAPSVASALAHVCGYGHYEFAVEEPEKFAVGMGVLVADKHAGGFYTTQATIVAREGDWFFIDRPFSHDYHPGKNGSVASLFSLVNGFNVRGAALQNITLDGNNDERNLNGCRGGGVFLLGCHDIQIENVEVLHYNGDAISFQQCTDIVVRGCHIHHNSGGGLHPGSGSVRYVLSENHIHDNGDNGIFYCLRTTHSRCEKNTIEKNGGCGISIGERDTDHLICENHIARNGGSGVDFRVPGVQSGDRVRLEKNRLEANCQTSGEAEITIADGLNQVSISGNSIAPEQGRVLLVGENCKEISFYDNELAGGASLSETDAAGVLLRAPEAFPDVGPESAPASAARHLNIEWLVEWHKAI